MQFFLIPPNRSGTSPIDLRRVPRTGDQGGVDHPRKFWQEHCISKVNGKYFDPSYGVGPFNGEIDYENTVIGAIDYTHSTFLGKISPRLRRQDPTAAYLKFTP